ncbi:MAG: 50S ribosomal protein L9 [Armatimonadetes bacterium]|nr:50S ribosomal protein L9 [Armatimonadota bacterium]
MQVILLEDVKALGKRGTVVKVNDGYARNFLFPKKLALEATEGNLRNLAHQDKTARTKHDREVAVASEAAEALKARPVRVVAKTGDKGKLYGAITSQDIANVLAQATTYPIDKRRIELKQPIKQVGIHKVRIKLHPEVVAEFEVEVVGGEALG